MVGASDEEEVRQEYERIWQRLGDRPIEALLDLPRITDPEARGTIDVLLESCRRPCSPTRTCSSCSLPDGNLSLEHGNSDGSCSAYVWLGHDPRARFGDYQAGFRFGKLGLDLVEQRGLERFKARAYMRLGAS